MKRFGHSTLPSHQLCLGAPRSHQRTWVDKDGAKPHQSSDILSPKQNLGAPYLARFWRDVGFHRSIPEHLPRQVCLSHPSHKSRSLILPDKVFLLREPHAVHQHHGSPKEIRGGEQALIHPRCATMHSSSASLSFAFWRSAHPARRRQRIAIKASWPTVFPNPRPPFGTPRQQEHLETEAHLWRHAPDGRSVERSPILIVLAGAAIHNKHVL
jgi:hypothetical protein